MKKILWMLLLLVNFQWVSAQEAQALINEFKTQKSAEYMNVSHAMMGIAALKVKNDNVKALLKQIKTMKILELSECDKNVRKKFIEKAQKLTVKGYEECTRVRDGDDNTLILMKGNDKVINELLVLSNDKNDCTFVLVIGQIDMNSLQGVIDMVEANAD